MRLIIAGAYPSFYSIKGQGVLLPLDGMLVVHRRDTEEQIMVTQQNIEPWTSHAAPDRGRIKFQEGHRNFSWKEGTFAKYLEKGTNFTWNKKEIFNNNNNKNGIYKAQLMYLSYTQVPWICTNFSPQSHLFPKI